MFLGFNEGKALIADGVLCCYSGVLCLMKKKLNYWIIYIFLTVGTSFLFNGGVFAGHTGDISLSKGGLGGIKLSGKPQHNPH
jgi:hypothetical protein